MDSNFQYAGAVNLIVAPFADRLFRLLDATSRVDGGYPGIRLSATAIVSR